MSRLGAVVLGLLVLASPGVAAAHASLENSTPENAEVLTGSPSSVTLTFGEPVQITLGGLRVIDAAGGRVDDGRPVHPDQQGTQVRVGLRERLASGTYLATWRVVSADSHPVAGSFTFSVGTPGMAPSAAGLHGNRLTALVLGAARFLSLAGLVTVLGGIAFPVLVQAAPGAAQLNLVRAGVIVTALASIVQFLLQGPYEAGLPPSRAFDPSLATVVAEGPFGTAIGLRLVGLVLLLACWRFVRALVTSRRATPWGTALVVVALGLTTLGFSAGGHARAQGWPHLALDVAHLTAAGIWLGGLLTLAVMLRDKLHAEAHELVGRLPRWSTVAATSVGVLVASGITAGWLETRGIGPLLQTTSGRLLLAKSALLLVMLVLANAARRRIAGHRRTRVAGGGAVGGSVLRVVRRSVTAETALAVVVLLVTTVLVQTQPAADAYAPIYDRFTKVGAMTVQTTVEPAIAGSNQLHVYVTDGTGRAIDVPEIRASFTLPAAGVAELDARLHLKDPGHWENLEVSLPRRGEWSLHIDIRTSDIDEESLDQVVRLR